MRYQIHLRDREVFIEARFINLAERIFNCYGYDVSIDSYGNIIDVDFCEDDMHEDEELYIAIAPFMRDGSYLEFFGELGDIWRWVFYGGECYKITALELWPDPIAKPTLVQEVLHLLAA